MPGKPKKYTPDYTNLIKMDEELDELRPQLSGTKVGRPRKKNNLMRNSVLKKAANRSYTPGTEEQIFKKLKKTPTLMEGLDPEFYEEPKRRKKPLSKEEQQKIMRPTLGTKKVRKRAPGSRMNFRYDEEKYGFPGKDVQG
tara:strand:+ start:109 stop:528 length:420 start_codon:yes stop_codon:yes gene_type:complete